MKRFVALLLLLCTMGCHRAQFTAFQAASDALVGLAEAKIHTRHMRRDFTYENAVVLTLSIRYPEIGLADGQAQQCINGRIQTELDALSFSAATTYYWQALGEYRYCRKNGIPFLTREATMQHEITLNSGLLSMYRDEYLYLGGAHGITVRHSDTFDLRTGKLLPLRTLLNDDDCKDRVLERILEQADRDMEKEAMYHDDYRPLITKAFNEESFYLTPEDIVFYFQEYDIAAYAAGIIEFSFPYER